MQKAEQIKGNLSVGKMIFEHFLSPQGVRKEASHLRLSVINTVRGRLKLWCDNKAAIRLLTGYLA